MAFNPVNYTAPEPKYIPVVLLLDTSYSMQGSKIDNLNKAVKTMIEEFKKVQTKERFIKVAIITFGNGGVQLHTKNMENVLDINFQDLSVGGSTPMGTALRMAKDMIEDRNIITSRDYRPAVVVVSDGQPNDEWRKPLDDFINTGRTKKSDRLALAIGSDADIDVLNRFIEGCDNPVFFAQEAKDIVDKFKQITMSVTMRTKSTNPNQTINVTSFEDDDEDELDF